jgi:hypothetical protein
MNRTREFWPLAPTGLALGLLAACLAPPAAAEANPYYIGASESVSHDNNLIRLADGQAAPDGYNRSDTVLSTALQAGIDQGFGRQHLSANLSLRDLHYQRNPTFNNQGYTGNLGLDWSTVERVSGSLLATTNRSLSTFNTYGVGLLKDRNYEDSQGYNATVSVGLVTRYSLEASLGHRAVSNTLDNQLVQARNFRQDTGGLTLYWQPSGATRIGLGLHETRGRYPKFRQVADGYQADRYKQQGVDLSATLQPSGASSIDARISQQRTTYDLNQARDFSGLTGSLAWNWQATGKLRLSTRLSRDTGQDSYAVTVFGNVPGSSDTSRLVNTLRVEAYLQQTAKLTFLGSAQIAQRNVVQTVINPLLPLNANGKDSSTIGSIGARWTPLRTVTVGCDVSQEVRTASGDLVTPLHNSSFACFGQLQFQP